MRSPAHCQAQPSSICALADSSSNVARCAAATCPTEPPSAIALVDSDYHERQLAIYRWIQSPHVAAEQADCFGFVGDMMPHTNEKAFNGYLAAALDKRHPRWEVNVEQSGVLRGQRGKSPDIIITPTGAKGGSPVVIETEYEPAGTVNDDAASRLGAELTSGGLIEQAVAVQIPKKLAGVPVARLDREITAAEFRYRLVSCAENTNAELYALRVSAAGFGYDLVRQSDILTRQLDILTYQSSALTADGNMATQEFAMSVPDPVYFPKAGWIRGGVDDLAGFCEQISLNENLLDWAVDRLEGAVEGVTSMLHKALEKNRQAVLESIAEALHQAAGRQTTRMGVAIVANALMFQGVIAGKRHRAHGNCVIPSPSPGDSRAKTLDVWKTILRVDYWPVFGIACSVLEAIPDAEAKVMIRSLTEMASDLANYGITSTGDMAGQMFGRLISDRKFLATFYTRPESAHLLAEMAAARLTADWGSYEQVTSLRISDLACGTGTLLTAAYQRIAVRVRRAGCDDQSIHSQMMEQVLIGADIMPAAVHLTASLLSSMHPSVTFDRTGIQLVPYGQVKDRRGSGSSIRIGSLEMLNEQYQQTSWLDSGGLIVGGVSDTEAEAGTVPLEHGYADLVIMNPPFTRPTNHKTAAAAGVPVPSFAGFGTEDQEQESMAKRLKNLNRKIKTPAGNGNAGLASSFIDLAHVKLKPGGTIAFVLPLTVVTGDAWSAARELLATYYRDICIVSIAATGSMERSFSADTGMAEVLIVATRCRSGKESDGDGDSYSADVLYVNLRERPANLVEGVEIARRIVRIASEFSDPLKAPKSGSVDVGDTQAGIFIRAGIGDGGCAAAAQPDLVMCASSLSRGELRLPRLADVIGDPLVRLRDLGTRGPVHRDINGWQGKPNKSDPRGPFDIEPLPMVEAGDEVTNKKAESTDCWAATYPVLWAHKAKRETRLVVEPDKQGRIRSGCDEKALAIWATASRLHFNLDFGLASQPLAACRTAKPCIGGRAWPTFGLKNERWEPPVLLWANTTLGLISFWWVGSRQHPGRAILTITRLPELMTVDPRNLTDRQLDKAARIFDSFKNKAFLPANEAYRDKTRRELDKAVLIDLLEFDEKKVMPSLALLRDQWCREPSVHGGKTTRP